MVRIATVRHGTYSHSGECRSSPSSRYGTGAAARLALTLPLPLPLPLPLSRRGELRAYLNRFLERNACCAEFSLVRDPSRWGVPHATAEGTPLLLFAVRPPWVPNEPLAAERQLRPARLRSPASPEERPAGRYLPG